MAQHNKTKAYSSPKNSSNESKRTSPIHTPNIDELQLNLWGDKNE
jgi:hypothetical protein